jgi:hypothetical protein
MSIHNTPRPRRASEGRRRRSRETLSPDSFEVCALVSIALHNFPLLISYERLPRAKKFLSLSSGLSPVQFRRVVELVEAQPEHKSNYELDGNDSIKFSDCFGIFSGLGDLFG